MASLPLTTWIRLIVWFAIGIVVYFTYSIHHSKLAGGSAPTDKPQAR
jgi:APA family basic amino acid/polyamine antiporter